MSGYPLDSFDISKSDERISLIMPDRKKATLEAWLRLHPEIEVKRFDRGGEYAAAARRGAPQAQHIADKFHLRLHLREKLKELMARTQKLVPPRS